MRVMKMVRNELRTIKMILSFLCCPLCKKKFAPIAANFLKDRYIYQMNSTSDNNNPRVHDRTVSVVVDARDNADDTVIHVIL